MINLKSIPFLKILLPFVLGIIGCLLFSVPRLHLFISVFFFSASIVVFILSKTFRKTNALKTVYMVTSSLFLIALAFTACFFYNQSNYKNHYTKQLFAYNNKCIVTVTDVSKRTKSMTIIPVDIRLCLINNNWKTVSGKTLLYYKDTSAFFSIGQSLLVHQKFSQTSKPKNPKEFDYKTYLAQKNIFNVLFVKPRDCFNVSVPGNETTFAQIGNTIKQKVIYQLKQLQLTQAAYSIAAALLVGYDDDIDSDIIQQFSHSGTLHILSVSGMHTGVVYAIVLFLFSLFDKHNKYKKTQCAIVVTLLWLLVTITGFSPSVMRAAIMLSLISVGKTFYKEGNAFNTLFISAFILLLFNPFLISDAGFLLSHFAVSGILYLYPIIYPIVYFNNAVLRWLWASSVISIAATIFTLPITLYYFHQFPIWFVLSNLVIIPLSMVLLFAALFAVVFIKVGFLSVFLVYISNTTTTVMLWFAKLTDSSSYGYIDNIPFSFKEVVLLSAIIWLLFVFIQTKSFKTIVQFCGVIVAWLLIWFISYENAQQKNELIIYSIKNKTAFSIALGHNLYIYQQGITDNEFNKHIKPYAINYTRKAIAINNQSSSIVLNKNVVLIRNNAMINFAKIKLSKPIIIADCSNNYKFVSKIKKQCAQFNLPFYSVKEKGAFISNIH